MTEPRFVYKLILAEPKSHLAELELMIEGLSVPFVDLRMPVWTPGSYLVREFARHVQELDAKSDGTRLQGVKLSKDLWRIHNEGRNRILLRYKVYCNEFTVRTSHLDDTHGFFNGASLFFDVVGHSHRPYELEIAPPGHWRISTALEKIGTRRYRAQNFDVLVDCPIEVGTHEVVPFEAANMPHEIVLYSEFPVDGRRLARDLAPVIDQAAKLFGGLPYKRYSFFVHLAPGLRGGLEHQLCSVSQGDPRIFENKELYTRFLELLSHEFFHTWNVKRIRPAAFASYDYGREAYTRLLWVFEGLTSYYELLLLVRASMLTPKEFLASLVRELEELAKTPGRRLQSLAQASFDAWIKYYRPDENSRNSSVSYYIKGCVVGCLLDLEMRRRSEGRVSLDDVMVAMWKRTQASKDGIEEDGFEALVAGVLGERLDAFFDAYVRGTEEIDANRFFSYVGLELSAGDSGKKEDGGPKGYLGVLLETSNGKLRIKEVLSDSAGAAAGLTAQDEIIALDGRRIDPRSFEEWIANRRPGTEVKLHLFRRERLREVGVRLGEAPPSKLELRPVRGLTDAQRRAFQAWTGAALDTNAAAEEPAAQAAAGFAVTASELPVGGSGPQLVEMSSGFSTASELQAEPGAGVASGIAQRGSGSKSA
jgi:predicted metalloprotease with PDZ domain